MKIVFCHPEHRKDGFTQAIVDRLELTAFGLGKTELYATIYPDNVPSVSFFMKRGYARVGETQTFR